MTGRRPNHRASSTSCVPPNIPRPFPSLLLALLATLLLAACSGPSPAALNGTYSGLLADDSVGTLGAHAMDVTTSGGSFSGGYCFVALNGDTACNAVSGTVSGTAEQGNVSFRVGDVSFHGTVTDNRSLGGRYSLTGGSGTFDMLRDGSSGSLTAAGLRATQGDVRTHTATGAESAFLDAIQREVR